MDLIVITDGAPSMFLIYRYSIRNFLTHSTKSLADPPNFELGSVLVQVANGVKAGPHHPNVMGVQFVQIGNDAGAKEALGKLLLADTGVSVC